METFENDLYGLICIIDFCPVQLAYVCCKPKYFGVLLRVFKLMNHILVKLNFSVRDD